MNDTNLPSDNPLRVRKSLLKNDCWKEIQNSWSKTERSKVQYNLDRQTAKIAALSLGNIGKYEFLTGKYVLPEKDLLEKAVSIKRFE